MSRWITFLLILLLSSSMIRVCAFEEVELDLSSDVSEKITVPKVQEKANTDKINLQNQNSDGNINHQNIHQEMNKDLYSSKTISNKKEKKFKKMTVGVKSDTKLAPESATQTRTIYSNYDITEKMSVGTSYKNSSNGVMSNTSQGSVSVAPEYRINKKMSIKNEYSRDFGSRTNKGELKLNVTPYEDGRMNFNAGVGQQQWDNGGGSSSQVNFGTNFRF